MIQDSQNSLKYLPAILKCLCLISIIKSTWVKSFGEMNLRVRLQAKLSSDDHVVTESKLILLAAAAASRPVVSVSVPPHRRPPTRFPSLGFSAQELHNRPANEEILKGLAGNSGLFESEVKTGRRCWASISKKHLTRVINQALY